MIANKVLKAWCAPVRFALDDLTALVAAAGLLNK